MAKKNFDKLMATFDEGRKKEQAYKDDKFSPEKINTLKVQTEKKEKEVVISQPPKKDKKQMPVVETDKKLKRLYLLKVNTISLLNELQTDHFDKNSGDFISISEIVDNAVQEFYKNTKK